MLSPPLKKEAPSKHKPLLLSISPKHPHIQLEQIQRTRPSTATHGIMPEIGVLFLDPHPTMIKAAIDTHGERKGIAARRNELPPQVDILVKGGLTRKTLPTEASNIAIRTHAPQGRALEEFILVVEDMHAAHARSNHPATSAVQLLIQGKFCLDKLEVAVLVVQGKFPAGVEVEAHAVAGEDIIVPVFEGKL